MIPVMQELQVPLVIKEMFFVVFENRTERL